MTYLLALLRWLAGWLPVTRRRFASLRFLFDEIVRDHERLEWRVDELMRYLDFNNMQIPGEIAPPPVVEMAPDREEEPKSEAEMLAVGIARLENEIARLRLMPSSPDDAEEDRRKRLLWESECRLEMMNQRLSELRIPLPPPVYPPAAGG